MPSEDFKLVSREHHPDDSVIELDGLAIGGGGFVVVAGPCAVESEEQCMAAAEAVKASGAQLFRGGAYKPRSSPYAFQGLGPAGLAILSKVKKRFGMPLVSEIMDARDLPYFEDVDVLQVGARNMQNYSLLKALGAQRKPVLLKRGMAATIDELLMSAEYLMAGGNDKVILCERGTRSYDAYSRNAFDATAVPVLRELSHLPVFVDPSHATGRASLVGPVACAAVAAGCDGLEIEVHPNPPQALSDGPQALSPTRFDRLMERCASIRRIVRDEGGKAPSSGTRA